LEADGSAWLQSHLRDYYGAVVMISDDRYLLENNCNWILELGNEGEGTLYEGKYSVYLERKSQQLSEELLSAVDDDNHRDLLLQKQRLLLEEMDWFQLDDQAKEERALSRCFTVPSLLAGEENDSDGTETSTTTEEEEKKKVPQEEQPKGQKQPDQHPEVDLMNNNELKESIRLLFDTWKVKKPKERKGKQQQLVTTEEKEEAEEEEKKREFVFYSKARESEIVKAIIDSKVISENDVDDIFEEVMTHIPSSFSTAVENKEGGKEGDKEEEEENDLKLNYQQFLVIFARLYTHLADKYNYALTDPEFLAQRNKKTILKAEYVQQYYAKNRWTQKITFDFPERGIVAFIGPDHPGKTAVLDVIEGKTEVDEGDLYEGENTKYCFPDQEIELNEEKTILENIVPLQEEDESGGRKEFITIGEKQYDPISYCSFFGFPVSH
jgi:ATPase subunit of ABC transporter with duplicated ATPase domains